MSNPLLNFDDLPAFSDIKAEHVVPAMETLLSQLEKELDDLESRDAISWQEFMDTLNGMHHRLVLSWGVVNHLMGVCSSEALRQAHAQVQPRVVQFGLKLGQSKKIYDFFRSFQSDPEINQGNNQRVIELNIKQMEQSGIGLPEDKRERFNQIATRLSELSTTFSNNVLDATKAFKLIVEEACDTEGMPQSLLSLMSQAYQNYYDNLSQEEQKTKTPPTGDPSCGPWLVTLDHPCYGPFMQHCRNRELRARVYKAFMERAASGPWDNSEHILEILRLRYEKAQLLGFKNYAALSVSNKMARHVDAVYKLIEDLRAASWDFALQEREQVENFARSQGFKEELKPWDVAFWTERLKEQRFKFTEEDLKPYFPLPYVLDGLFHLVEKIFHITVEPADGEVTTWHPDVQFFKVFDKSNHQHLASFYLDPYSRPENKRGGAWMDVCIQPGTINGKTYKPVAYLVCNSSPPLKNQPSLLTFREVETLFHEFGHGLQHMLTEVDNPMVSGIEGIEWDAVELPSQFMENWCYHKKTLMQVAHHYETSAAIPDELFYKLKRARTFMSATMMLRQLRFGKTDFVLHERFNPMSAATEEVFDLALDIAREMQVMPLYERDRMLCSFNHIFAGGYAAGYYSYKWAEVLSADAFAAFEEANLDDDEAIARVGMKFRKTILARGGSQDPNEVYQEFRGRAPSHEALLRHVGLVDSEQFSDDLG